MYQKIAVNNLEELPRFEIISKIKHANNSLSNSANSDIDANLPCQVNFNYYSTHDFHNNTEIKESLNQNTFSILHCNIRSLSANFDNFISLLADLDYPFSIIGLSENKFNKLQSDNVCNTDLPGYNFKSSLSQAGGGRILREK